MDELSDEDLEKIAGGSVVAWLVATLGAAISAATAAVVVGGTATVVAYTLGRLQQW